MPEVQPSHDGLGWEIVATGLSLLMRMHSSIVSRNGSGKMWPHYELFSGLDWDENKAPIFVRCFKPSKLIGKCTVKSPRIECGGENGPTFLIRATEMSLGLQMVIENSNDVCK